MPRKTINKKPVNPPRPPKDMLKNKLMLALVESLGNISSACESCGVSRDFYYKYYDQDENFRQHAEKCRERRIDFAEHKLDKLIEQENPTAIIFLLKTIGKNRGYIEKQEVDHTSKGEAIVQPPPIIVQTAETVNDLKTLLESDK